MNSGSNASQSQVLGIRFGFTKIWVEIILPPQLITQGPIVILLVSDEFKHLTLKLAPVLLILNPSEPKFRKLVVGSSGLKGPIISVYVAIPGVPKSGRI